MAGWTDIYSTLKDGVTAINSLATVLRSVVITGNGVPPGGATGEVLTKLSGANYDTGWASGGASVPVSIVDGGTGETTAADAFDALKQAATDTYAGVSELATSAEVNTGTDTGRTVTPATLAAKTFKDYLSGIIPTPANGDYVILRNAPFALTWNTTTTKSSAGTCTLTGKINTTPIGATANSVSTAEVTQTASSANSASAGDDIVLTVSSNSSCANLEFTVVFTRTLGIA